MSEPQVDIDPPRPKTYLERKAERAGIEQRNRNIFREAAMGRPIAELAYTFELTEKQVKYIIWKFQSEFRHENKDLVANVKAKQLAMNQLLEQEAMRAWQRSTEDAVEIKSGNAQVNARGEVVDLPDVTITKGQSGNASFLSLIVTIQKDTRKIVGADLPEKIEMIISDEDAKLQLQTRMADLVSKQLPEDDTERIMPQLTEDASERLVMMREVAAFKERKTVEKIATLPLSVRAETTDVGIDLPGESFDS